MAWQPTPQSFRDSFQVKNPRPDGYPTGWRGPMGGFGQPPGQNAFAPGPPSPQQPAGQAPSPAGNFSAYAPGQAQSQQSPWATATPYGQQPAWAQQLPFGGQNAGLPPFQFRATDFMGNRFDNPGDFTAQQGAMAQALNQQRSRQISQGNFGPLNPQLAFQQGQQMIQDGWQNPFAEPPSSPQDFGRHFTPPPGFGQGEVSAFPVAGGLPAGPPSPVRGNQDQAGDGVRRLRGNPPAPQSFESRPARFGTPPGLRGMARTTDWRDTDGDGVDDRDQDGPGMQSYGRPNSKTAVPPQYSFGSSDFGMPQQWPQNDSERVARPTVSMPFAPRGPQTPAPRRQSIFVPRNPSLPSRRGAPRPLYPGQPGYAQAARQRR